MSGRSRDALIRKGGRRNKPITEDVAADWGSLQWDKLGAAVARICSAGGAVRFGYTKDGGAYAIGVYGDGNQPYTDYLRPSENPVKYLEDLAEVMETPL